MVNKKSVFVFPGQGSQSVGMMSAYEESQPLIQSVFAEASAVLAYDLYDLVQNGPQESLNQTEVTQPAVLAAGVAIWRLWFERGGPAPDFLAGHSLGEYTALVAAGVLQFKDAIGLVAERGRSMQAATPPGSGAMAAILGLDDQVVMEVCELAAQDEVVSCANFNSPGQIVIAGNAGAVERAIDLASKAGARKVIPLAVSVPSHCALMAPAAEHMNAVLQSIEFSQPSIPVVHNWDVRSHASGERIRQALINQLCQPVRWTETVLQLIELGGSRFVECGPGKVLAGLARRISKTVKCVPLTGDSAISETIQLWEGS